MSFTQNVSLANPVPAPKKTSYHLNRNYSNYNSLTNAFGGKLNAIIQSQSVRENIARDIIRLIPYEHRNIFLLELALYIITFHTNGSKEPLTPKVVDYYYTFYKHALLSGITGKTDEQMKTIEINLKLALLRYVNYVLHYLGILAPHMGNSLDSNLLFEIPQRNYQLPELQQEVYTRAIPFPEPSAKITEIYLPELGENMEEPYEEYGELQTSLSDLQEE